MGDSPTQRLDKWLWATRWFKTRSQAAEAVNGGLVHVEGQRVKAAKLVRPGHSLRITKGPYSFDVHILGLAEKRGPATTARALYEESEESIEHRAATSAARAEARLAEPDYPDGRPSKRDRRRLFALKHSEPD